MPSKTTRRRARNSKRRGNKSTTQAGAYVREEMEHKKRGKHKIKNRKQAIAIGLSKARRSGINVPKKSKSRKRSSSRSKSSGSSSKRSSGRRSAASRNKRKSRSRSGSRSRKK
jgi:hypothetical protein